MGVVSTLAQDYSPVIGLHLAIRLRITPAWRGKTGRWWLGFFMLPRRFAKPFAIYSLQLFVGGKGEYVYLSGSRWEA
jgi:hypothetical protein